MRILINRWVHIGVDELEVRHVVGDQMEQPESPHDWIANQVLKIPKLEYLDLGLVEVCHTLEYFHVLQPIGLDHVGVEPVLWNVPRDIDVETVLEQERQENWCKQNLNLIDDSLLNVLERALEGDTFKGGGHIY